MRAGYVPPAARSTAAVDTLMAIWAVSPKCRAWLPVLIDDPAWPDAARERVLADHHPQRLDQRHQHVEGAAAEPYRPAVGGDPETADRHHRGGDRRGELRAMIKIDIFKENHRSSD